MGLSRRAKAPKYQQGTPGKASRFARSSMKQPKPKGTDPKSLGYGITQTGTKSVDQTAARGNKLFGSGSANASAQGALTSKVKRSTC